MDARAAKLALARKKLKDHQEKKQQENTHTEQKENNIFTEANISQENSQTPQYYQQPSTAQLEQCDGNSNNGLLELKQSDMVVNNNTDNDINATEILISSKRVLELQINSLQAKMIDLENMLTSTTQNYNDSCQKIAHLENDLKYFHNEYKAAAEQLMLKDTTIKELSDVQSSLLNEKNGLQDQLEFTKSVLSAKEAENSSLHGQLFHMEKLLDATQLQLQQLTSGAISDPQDQTSSLKQQNEILIQKVSHLEQQLKIQNKDYQQLNNQYEHYVGELNKQLKQVMHKNEELDREVQKLSDRENSLVEQIGDLEIRLQNYKKGEMLIKEQRHMSAIDNTALHKVQEDYEKARQELQDLHSKHAELQRLYEDSRAEVENLIKSREIETQPVSEHVSLLKLNADITSDKIAAQRATEQNRKLKEDIHGLEDAFVKMTKDKLELTEKITAEKFLNRELTIKLAEVDEKANDMQRKLKAKDEEMIRLQTSYRIIEEKYNEIAEHLKHLSGSNDPEETTSIDNDANGIQETDSFVTSNHSECHNHGDSDECHNNNRTGIPKSDAMLKLQERFLKIMDEVADLSDEKHRLEHIITQLQNETDTICEYVALYQQQRCLLKKRDEERSAQMKMFQSECARLQSQLDELTGILTRFAEDKQLSSYFQVEAKHEDIQKVMKLLSKLKTNSLIDPQKSIKFNDFYPCSCCSGQLIEV